MVAKRKKSKTPKADSYLNRVKANPKVRRATTSATKAYRNHLASQKNWSVTSATEQRATKNLILARKGVKKGTVTKAMLMKANRQLASAKTANKKASDRAWKTHKAYLKSEVDVGKAVRGFKG